MIKDSLKVCMVQMDILWEDKKNNLLRIDQYLNFQDKELDLIILPEMFSTGFTMNAVKMAESDETETIAWMKEKSIQHNAVLTGSIIFKEKNRFYNRLIWMKPDGNWLFYDKRHLFRMGGEDIHYSAGKKQLITNLCGWNIFPLICYDLRFPVWSRNTGNYDLLIYIANWPASRRRVWDTLLSARAMENQAYVCGINRVGTDIEGIKYNGGTKMIDPKGDEICTFKDHEESAGICELSLPLLRNFRKKFPVLKDQDNFEISF